jgi:ubiquitin conjugation factor E4 B
MYANMAHLDKFRENVVLDARSYSDETFAKAAKILNSTKKDVSVATEVKEKFEVLVVQLKAAKEAATAEEIDFDDAPEEFLDPLMATLMEDPVELPDSRYIIDRTTIE